MRTRDSTAAERARQIEAGGSLQEEGAQGGAQLVAVPVSKHPCARRENALAQLGSRVHFTGMYHTIEHKIETKDSGRTEEGFSSSTRRAVFIIGTDYIDALTNTCCPSRSARYAS